MSKYAIGIDYGTESARALLIEIGTNREVATTAYKYPGGVIDEALEGVKLPPDWALQDPADYLWVLGRLIPDLLRQSAVDPAEVVGIGVDFTACTILPVDAAGSPLCFDPRYRQNPHSWVKLWKHHAAQPEADKINVIAAARQERFLPRYGGKVSSEWLIPKVWQVLDEAPAIYEAADRFMEAGDWLVLQLTGVEARSSCQAGYKGLWHKRDSFPDEAFFKALDPRLEDIVGSKLSRNICSVGQRAGYLTAAMAAKTGLCPGTAVGVAIIDAHAAVPAMGAAGPGKMVMVMGTSLCHMVISDVERMVPGISGVVEDGIIPGLFCYEAGQAAVGDIFAWFVENGLPQRYFQEAAGGLSEYKLLEEKAARLKPGECGLVALDWWNGNRSVLTNAHLSGLLLGFTLKTRPEDIYRALIEATAFGTNMIIETFEANGVKIDELYACGGLAEKNNLLLQIYADVTGRDIRTAASRNICALGAAMFGAVAAGREGGGYDNLGEAAAAGLAGGGVIRPIAGNVAAYKRLFAEYVTLHDYFGRGGNNVMERLKAYHQD